MAAKYDKLGNRTNSYGAADIGVGLFQLAAILAIPVIALYFVFKKKPEESEKKP